jgi:general secretion pathway protein C
MLEVRGEREPLLRRRGPEVLAIGIDRALLTRNGKACVARMFPGSRRAAGSPTPAAAAVTGVVRTGPGEFALDRAVRDALIDGAAMNAVSVRPEKVGDDVVGLRIATLKPGTALEALGLRAGDVLSTVDGIPLTSPDRMLEAYARIRTASHARLSLIRDGKPMQLDYDVR